MRPRDGRRRKEFATLRAEVVSVGTELLLGQIVDTNAAYIAKALSAAGVSVYRRSTVGDNMDRLIATLSAAFGDNDIVITIGGLGPTMDDITRDGVAAALNDKLVQNGDIAAKLTKFFADRGIEMTESNLRQAMVPVHGKPIDNPNGTAPGLLFEKDGKIAICLPGPPNEFIPMVDDFVSPYLLSKTGNKGTIRSRVLRVIGMGESSVEQIVKDLMLDDNPTVAPYAKVGEVHLRVTARHDTAEQAEQLVEERAALVRSRLGRLIYGEDNQTLEQAVVSLLLNNGSTISVAESCTGGMLAQRITDIPGSSRAFPGGLVCYSNNAKVDLAGVSQATLDKHGAVSHEVATDLALGVRKRFSTTFGIGITGIAGPDGGTEEKPVGLVYIALADSKGCKVERTHMLGARNIVRTRSVQTALNMVRLSLLTPRH